MRSERLGNLPKVTQQSRWVVAVVVVDVVVAVVVPFSCFKQKPADQHSKSS